MAVSLPLVSAFDIVIRQELSGKPAAGIPPAPSEISLAHHGVKWWSNGKTDLHGLNP
jgi:hypothetical protein